MKDNNGTKQACSGAVGAAGLLALLAACAEVPPAASPSASGPIATQFPLLSRTYPGLVNDESVIIIDDTQADTVVYYNYEYGSPGPLGYFPNGSYAPYGYFGYPYRYRPYGAYPRQHHPDRSKSPISRQPPFSTGCGAACGRADYGAGSGWDRPDIFVEPPERSRRGRARGVPQIGPQSPAVGPQPALVGPRPVQPLGWRGQPSR